MTRGGKTTEFYLTVATAVIGILVMLGIIDPDQQSEMIQAVEKIIGAVITIWTTVNYAIQRRKIKTDSHSKK